MTEEKTKQLLFEVVKKFSSQEWFRDAAFHENYRNTGEPKLIFKVNYVPIFEKKDIIAFAQSKALGYDFIVVDKDGKPVE